MRDEGKPAGSEHVARRPRGFTNEPAAPTPAQALRLGHCRSLAGNGGTKRAALQTVEIARLEGAGRGGHCRIIGEMLSFQEDSPGGYFKS